MNDEQQAQMYDQMINWEGRLGREIPVITAYFQQLQPAEGSSVLDMACSSGRHSLALAEMGYSTVGVDVSGPFINLAREIAGKHAQGDRCEFLESDAAGSELMEKLNGRYFDHAILLGNAIANMGNFEQGKSLMKNIFMLLRPGGTAFIQTIHRPTDLWYNPLRKRENTIIQRIMVPVSDNEVEHNVVLHVNQIVAEEGPLSKEFEDEEPQNVPYYLRQASDNTFFMYTRQEFTELVTSIGFEVEAVYHHYSQDPPLEADGETQTWRLKKPDMELKEAGIELFQKYAGIGEPEIRSRTLEIWQDIMLKEWYHCMRGYRFLYPRITAHPRYGEVADAIGKDPELNILDIACHMGTDLRQLQLEGATQLTGIDLHGEFFEAGYHIFGDRDSCIIDFHEFDLLSPEFLEMDHTRIVGGEFAKRAGEFDIIHAGSLLHLLDQAEIRSIVERVYVLLGEKGVFFGRTVGSTVPESHGTGLRFLHSTESLQHLLNTVGFSEVEAVEMPRGGPKGESSNSTVLQIGFYAKK